MKQEDFLLKSRIAEIENGFKLKNGWIKICEGKYFDGGYQTYEVYCSLIKKQFIEEFKDRRDLPLLKGDEGKANIYGDNSYKSNDSDKIEPFLFHKRFSINNQIVKYIDVSEEFVLYFKLYEEIIDKQHRTYYFVDDYGELDEVLVIENDIVKVKSKYLKEYITMRDMYLFISFDFNLLLEKSYDDWNFQYGENDFQSSNYFYNHLVRFQSDLYQSWIMGNYYIEPNKVKSHYLDMDRVKYEDFIIGIDEEGENVLGNPKTASTSDFTFTYFRKNVLDKYYNNPTVYTIDGFSLRNNYFRLRMDNNQEDRVAVFLSDLRTLPPKEQLHWKQYNISVEEGKLSPSFYNTMIEGKWNEQSDTLDLLFKEKYRKFNKLWIDKYGWALFKPLAEEDIYLLDALHLITDNNIKTFCEQCLTIVKLLVDRINEKEISKDLEIPKNMRGIGKLELYCKSIDLEIPDMFEFLRNLQSLRSGLIAHTFSKTNKECKKAMKYFAIGEKDYRDVFKDILIKSIKSLNTFQTEFALVEKK